MKPHTLSQGVLLYEADVSFNPVVEYGVSIDAITSGEAEVPLEGARFDQTFQGHLSGPRIRGTIQGTDYMYIRADGRFQLHLHGLITTDDDVNVSMQSEGVSIHDERKPVAHLRSVVSLFTSSPEYAWLNKANIWAMGTIDLETGKASVAAYQV